MQSGLQHLALFQTDEYGLVYFGAVFSTRDFHRFLAFQSRSASIVKIQAQQFEFLWVVAILSLAEDEDVFECGEFISLRLHFKDDGLRQFFV